jgi:DNA polymerase-3 subunit epsilon
MTETERLVIKRRNEAIAWAQYILAHKDHYVICDTETTGLDEKDVIVHFAVMDLSGAMLIDTLVKPMSKRRMSSDATYVHGITMKDLKGAPLFEEVVELLRPIAERKKLLSYNASFHSEMFEQTYEYEGVSGPPIRLLWLDVKEFHLKFLNKDRAYLPGRNNTGSGDCQATLALLEKMAAEDQQTLPPEPPKNDSIWQEYLIWFVFAAVLVFWWLKIFVFK